MSYAQLDVHFDEHVKFEGLSLAHLGLMACAIAYANRTLSDGRIPRRKLAAWGVDGEAAGVVDELIRRGIWQKSADGYVIVGYLDHNPSAAQVKAKMALKRERQARFYEKKKNTTPKTYAGSGSFSTRRKGVNVDDLNRVNSSVVDGVVDEVKDLRDPDLTRARSAPPAEPSSVDVVFDLDEEPPPPKRPKAKRRVGIPTPAPPSDASPGQLAEWANGHGIDTAHPQFEKFVNWHRINGKASCDWKASWRTWLANDARFARERESGRHRVVQPSAPAGEPSWQEGPVTDFSQPESVWRAAAKQQLKLVGGEGE
jgi:hypothetical protein